MSEAEALELLKSELGLGVVIATDLAQKLYGDHTLSSKAQRVAGALRPRSTEEVRKIVRIASAYKISLYPISTGRNWGYGSTAPAAPGCIVLDLSLMKTIRAIDPELGVVSVEPGVTAGQLEHYLLTHHIEYLAPTTAAGPNTSLVGNMLERGISNGQAMDRFQTLLSLKAVLPGGELYESSATNLLNKEDFNIFKWGIGPYLDGLFGQSALGVVTEATFALQPRPSHAELFYGNLSGEQGLSGCIDAVRAAMRRLPRVVSMVKIFNGRRLRARLSPGAVCGVLEWVVVGTVEGERPLVREAQKILRGILRPALGPVWTYTGSSKRALFENRKERAFLEPLLSSNLAYSRGIPSKGNNLLAVNHLFHSLSPTEREQLRTGEIEINAISRAGLLFFVAVAPLRGEKIEPLLAKLEAICLAHNIDPLIQLSIHTEKMAHLSLPLLFDKADTGASENAHACHRELHKALKPFGAYVYRQSIVTMDESISDSAFWRLARRIKNAVDPDKIISPGRYE